MPASATLVGAAMGLGVQFYSNAVRKLPLMRREFTRGAVASAAAAAVAAASSLIAFSMNGRQLASVLSFSNSNPNRLASP
ncbi:unnamed protein product [Closterium sp. NIES-54]